MKTTKLTLTLEITYSNHGVSKKYLKENLSQFVLDGMSNGVFTGDSKAEIDTHYYEITEA